MKSSDLSRSQASVTLQLRLSFPGRCQTVRVLLLFFTWLISPWRRTRRWRWTRRRTYACRELHEGLGRVESCAGCGGSPPTRPSSFHALHPRPVHPMPCARFSVCTKHCTLTSPRGHKPPSQAIPKPHLMPPPMPSASPRSTQHSDQGLLEQPEPCLSHPS